MLYNNPPFGNTMYMNAKSYPWTNLDNINLDWFIVQMQEVLKKFGYYTEDYDRLREWLVKELRNMSQEIEERTDESTITTIVERWLSQHPEVMIPDGSITNSKLAPDSVKLQNLDTFLRTTIMDTWYSYPEKYGAKGDGRTDDTNAIIQCFNDGKPIICGKDKNYRISNRLSGTIEVKNNFYGNGSTFNLDSDCLVESLFSVAKGVTMKDFTVICENPNTPASFEGHVFPNIALNNTIPLNLKDSGVTVTNVVIENFTIAISKKSTVTSKNVNIRNINVNNCLISIGIANVTDSEIENIHIKSKFNLTGNQYCRPFYISSYCRNIMVKDVLIEGDGVFHDVLNCHDATNDSTNTIDKITFMNVLCTVPCYYPLAFTNSNNITVRNAKFTSCDTLLHGSSTGATVDDCEIYDSYFHIVTRNDCYGENMTVKYYNCVFEADESFIATRIAHVIFTKCQFTFKQNGFKFSGKEVVFTGCNFIIEKVQPRIFFVNDTVIKLVNCDFAGEKLVLFDSSATTVFTGVTIMNIRLYQLLRVFNDGNVHSTDEFAKCFGLISNLT